MSLLFTLIAAGQLSTLISAAPLKSSHFTKRVPDSYVQFTGSGATPEWPQQSSWQSFDSMFSDNMSILKSSCTQWNVDNNSNQEIADLKSAISSVASSSSIPAQFILAVVLQESNGCVRAPTTTYSVRNPGLMQDHDGAGTCNDGGSVQNPCPSSQITQMIKDGVEGTAAGDGLKQCIAQAGSSDVSKYYKAARIYNSGRVTDDDLSAGVATHCYASDIANRLTGWATAPHDCNLDGASVPVNTAPAAQPSSAAPPSSVSTPASTPASTPSTTSISTPAATPTSKPTPAYSGIATALPSLSPVGINNNPPANVGGAKAPKPSTAAASPSVSPSPTVSPTPSASPTPPAATATAAPAAPAASGELAPGVSSSCPQLYTVADGDNCWTLGQKFGFTFSQFQGWNTQVDAACSNLWKGYQYCVKG